MTTARGVHYKTTWKSSLGVEIRTLFGSVGRDWSRRFKCCTGFLKSTRIVRELLTDRATEEELIAMPKRKVDHCTVTHPDRRVWG